MPQSATLTSFRSPIPAISHFDVLGFNTDTFENLSKTSITDSWFFRKNVVSSVYAVYKIHIRTFSDRLSFYLI